MMMVVVVVVVHKLYGEMGGRAREIGEQRGRKAGSSWRRTQRGSDEE
jgi:hypothetical protein